jgi:hypothetical protein
MESAASRPSIRESLDQLLKLLDEPWTRPGNQLLDAIDLRLEQLEQALDDKIGEERLSESLGDTRRTHPRLIALCNEFDRDGRNLLRHAALVIRLSARHCEASDDGLPKLREAVASLIEAVEQYLQLQEKLAGEAAQEIGGEG